MISGEELAEIGASREDYLPSPRIPGVKKPYDVASMPSKFRRGYGSQTTSNDPSLGGPRGGMRFKN